MPKKDKKINNLKAKKYALVKNVDGVESIEQTQPYPQEGFIEVPNNAKFGFIKKGKKWVMPPLPELSHSELRVSGTPQYQPIGEQLDAIWKHINQQRLDGVKLPQETDDALNHVLRVKKTHPKKEK